MRPLTFKKETAPVFSFADTFVRKTNISVIVERKSKIIPKYRF
jgi:hypothetical protein